MAQLEPTEAQRLSRLRILLASARSRISDSSDPGLHAGVLAVDGAGELAIGLCMHKLGLNIKQGDGVPKMLDRLLGKLDKAIPGIQGYRELHRMRNLVQHEGVLPAPEQLPRWLAETETMCEAIVEASFGVFLNEVGSADGVSDHELQALLKTAEVDFNRGAAESSFEASWNALDLARQRLRSQTGALPARPPITAGLGGSTRSLGELFDRVNGLSEQLELYAFTSDPGEWLWFRERRSESLRGLPPTLADAGRAFVFVLTWVLRFEAYIARHGFDRWERWEESQKPPVTGVPNGPHIRDVDKGQRRRTPRADQEDEIEWIFELTDVPEASQPNFEWAVNKVAMDMADPAVASTAYLDPAGRMTVVAPASASGDDVWCWVETLLPTAKAELNARQEQNEAYAQLAGQLIIPFREAFQRTGLGVKQLVAKPPDNGIELRASDAVVWIELEEPPNLHSSWFGKALQDSFEQHFPEAASQSPAPAPYGIGFYDATVPVAWDPDRVAAWMVEAVEIDANKREADAAVADAKKAEENKRLQELRDHLDSVP